MKTWDLEMELARIKLKLESANLKLSGELFRPRIKAPELAEPRNGFEWPDHAHFEMPALSLLQVRTRSRGCHQFSCARQRQVVVQRTL